MRASKRDMLDSLPFGEGDVTIRAWTREDVDLLAEWPSYPSPYEAFNFIYAGFTPEQRDERFRGRNEQPDRLSFVVDSLEQPAVMYVSFVEIDWATGRVGNMAIRVRPDWCDKGIGTLILRGVADWAFQHGITSLRLDVCAANPRAVRCYEKVGFVRTGEFWHDDEAMRTLDRDLLQYDLLRPHVRLDRPVPQIRFYWMEMTPKSPVTRKGLPHTNPELS